MAKKKTTPPSASAGQLNPPSTSARRRAPRKKSEPSAADVGAVTVSSEIDSASDVGDMMGPIPSAYSPSYDEIAEIAYRRYLSRGGGHGQDFEDWLEAERELRQKRS